MENHRLKPSSLLRFFHMSTSIFFGALGRLKELKLPTMLPKSVIKLDKPIGFERDIKSNNGNLEV